MTDEIDKRIILKNEIFLESEKMKKFKVEFSCLLGKKISFIKVSVHQEYILFITHDGERYLMEHKQECCERVYIESITGDLNDLLDTPILLAEESICHDENPVGAIIPKCQDSFTWSFYKLGTIKGYVDIRWYGGSNGYYGEEVTLYMMNDDIDIENYCYLLDHGETP